MNRNERLPTLATATPLASVNQNVLVRVQVCFAPAIADVEHG